jgi:hypothetical protein
VVHGAAEFVSIARADADLLTPRCASKYALKDEGDPQEGECGIDWCKRPTTPAMLKWSAA